MKPFISIITPAHKVLPWQNLRLINICSQSFDNWEWLILDNSQDGCVKQYVDDFFTKMQGEHYQHCREKIKCWHDPMPAVKIEDGRLGILRNWLIENTNCGDEGFILVLDFDDFIYPGFLENIAKVHERYPECELINGQIQQCFAQYETNGDFIRHDAWRQWITYIDVDQPAMLESHGFSNMKNWDVYKHNYLNGNLNTYITIDRSNSLTIPYTNFILECDTITTIGENGFGLNSGVMHPIVYKKGAFLKNIKKYITNIAPEDYINQIMPFLLNQPVFIDAPCYCQIMILDDTGMRESGTGYVLGKNDNEISDLLYARIFKQKYGVLKDCMNFIKPII